MSRTQGRRGGPRRARSAGARGRAGAAPGPGAGAQSRGAAGARADRPLPRRLGRLFPTPTLLLRAPCRSPFHLPPARRSHVSLPRPAPPPPPPPAPRPPSQIGRERASRRGRAEGGDVRRGGGRAPPPRGPPSRGGDRTAWRRPPAGVSGAPGCAGLRGPEGRAGGGMPHVRLWRVGRGVAAAVADGTRVPRSLSVSGCRSACCVGAVGGCDGEIE